MQKTILLLAAGMLFGMATCSLLRQPNRSFNDVPVSPHATVARLQQTEQQQETAYQAERMNLLQQVNTLHNARQQVTRQLIVVKAANKQLQQQVAKTIEQLAIKTDTSAYMRRCDSLQQETLQLSGIYHLQDSLTEEQVSALQKEGTIKDKLVLAADTRLQSVNTLLHQSIVHNQLLEAELVFIKKQNKKQRFHSTLKTLAMITAAFWLGKQ